MRRSIIILFIIFLNTINVFCQNNNDLWIFGKGASLKFDSPNTQPYALTEDFLINSSEAAATGFDQNGNLLFYSDGKTIWNFKNEVIYDSLLGANDATQGITVIRSQENDKDFILFTTNTSVYQDGSYLYKLNFSKNPNGEVEPISLHLPSSERSYERLEVVKHHNNEDYWIILNPHSKNYTTYLIYLYKNGKITLKNKYISTLTRNFNKGYLKASPDGRILASADYDGNKIEFALFDNDSGKIISNTTFSSKILETGVYGLEFSKNSKILYLTTYEYISGFTYRSKCIQFDAVSYLFSGQVNYNIVAQFEHSLNSGGMWALRRGIDNKIYIARNNKSYLSVIEQPNSWGAACLYKENGPSITINNDISLLGLPSTTSNVSGSEYELLVRKICEGDKFIFTPNLDIDYNHYSWLGNSKEFDSKDLIINPINRSDDGVYYLTDKVTNEIVLAVRIKVGTPSDFNFIADPDRIVCQADTVTISIDDSFEDYLWSDGSKDSILKVTKSGIYTLTVTNSYGCTTTKSIGIKFLKPPDFFIEKEIIDCNNVFKLTCNQDFDNYYWSTNEKTKSIVVKKPGTYTLTISISNECIVTKSVEVENIVKKIDLEFPYGNFICQDERIEVKIANPIPECKYKWSNGSSEYKTVFDKPGKYYVDAIDTITGCTYRKEFTIYSAKDFKLELKTSYDCKTNNVKLYSNADNKSFNFLWSNGSQKDTIIGNIGDTYTLQIESKSKNCYFSDTITVASYTNYNINLNFPEGKYICSDDSLEVFVDSPHPRYKYHWSNGTHGIMINIHKPGVYYCFAEDTITHCKDTASFEIKDLYDFKLALQENFDCSNSTNVITSNAKKEIFDFEWSNGSKEENLIVDKVGKYSLKVTTKSGCSFYDTVNVTKVRSFDLNIVAYPNDTICSPGSVTLKLEKISPAITSKIWSNGSRKDSIIVTKSGMYFIKANDANFCYLYDTVYVEIVPTPEISINSSKGKSICENESTTLTVDGLDNLSNYEYHWSNGGKNPSIVVYEAGTYQLIVNVKGADCSDTAYFQLETLPTPELSISGKNNFCDGESTLIYAKYSNGTLRWSNGSENDSLNINIPGVYIAKVTNSLGCSVSDTITIVQNSIPKFNIIGDKFICSGDTTHLVCSKDYEKYLWSTGDTSKSIQVTKSGVYTLQVIDSNGCSNTNHFEVIEDNNSFYITNINITKDSLMTGDDGNIRFTINNMRTKASNYQVDFMNKVSNITIAGSNSKGMDFKLDTKDIGFHKYLIKIKSIGSCSKDTILEVEYSVYTIIKAVLPDKYYPYLNQSYLYPFTITSTIPLNLELSYSLKLPNTIFLSNDISKSNQPINLNFTHTENIKGFTILGDLPNKQMTSFNFISTNNPYVIVDTTNGSIEITTVCMNDKRLVEFNFYNPVNIYPNPVNDYLTLDFGKNNNLNLSITIINELGQAVYENQIIVNDIIDIELNSLPVGTYNLILKSDLWKKSFRFSKLN